MADDGDVDLSLRPTSTTCSLCDKTLSSQGVLNRHIRVVHKLPNYYKNGKVQKFKCPADDCDQTILSKSHLNCHLKEVHQIEVVQEQLQFNSLAEFMVWKQETEIKNNSSYINRSATKFLEDGSKRTYYICLTAVKYDSAVVDNNGKRERSDRSGKVCPSQIVVTVAENTDYVQVHYTSTHVGHQEISTSDEYEIEDFFKAPNLIDPLMAVDGDVDLSLRPTSITCSLCDKTFSSQGVLNRHIRGVHKLPNYYKNGKVQKFKCPADDCDQTISSKSYLNCHLKEVHQIEIVHEQLQFNSLAEFMVWKQETEIKNNSRYTNRSATKVLEDGSKRTYYICRTAVKYDNTVVDSNKKRARCKRSDKVCPSQMIVTVAENADYVQVHYTSTHVGHQEMSTSDKYEIEGNLQRDVAFGHIMDSVRNGEESDHSSKGLLLLDQKYLLNIVRDFNIQYSTRHKNDSMSVKLWMEEMLHINEDNPVLYYKSQGYPSEIFDDEDFVLMIMTSFQVTHLIQFGTDNICIDSTHGTNECDIQMFTIMTVDKFGSGCPVAFCFTNREDELVLKVFFGRIKEKAGLVRTTTFMSVNTPALYNAWSAVMGIPKHKLLCSRVIECMWQQDEVNRKIQLFTSIFNKANVSEPDISEYFVKRLDQMINKAKECCKSRFIINKKTSKNTKGEKQNSSFSKRKKVPVQKRIKKQTMREISVNDSLNISDNETILDILNSCEHDYSKY